MSRLKSLLAVSLMVCMGYVGSAFALFGLGVHYSLDFSVKMDAADQKLVFDSLNLETVGFGGTMPAGWTGQTFGPEDIPIYFKHGDMGRTPFGIGGKLYVDIIPFIDCIEIGGNFAAFEYDGKIIYPTSIAVNAGAPADPGALLTMMEQDLVSVVYDTLSTNIEDLAKGTSIPGISKTPYAKLDLGLSLRKYIPIPVVDNFLRPYGGLGFDVTFATPVPSPGLVNDAIGEGLTGNMSLADLDSVMREAPQKVVDEIIARLMTPHFGMNIVVGFMLKPPVFPVGLYIDGKFAIPFDKLDENANVTAMGFKLNGGLCLHFGKKRT